MALAVGSRLGHYDVTALIGEGGMGQVYRAVSSEMRTIAADVIELMVCRRWLVRARLS